MFKITLNGSMVKVNHQIEVEALFNELRKCLIEVPNLSSVTKAFLLMSLDLYYNGFRSLGTNMENFYGNFLDEHDIIERRNRPPSEFDVTKSNDNNLDESSNTSYSLRNLAKDFADLKPGARTNGGKEEHRKINREYLNRPLKANERLKYFQNSSNEIPTIKPDDSVKSPRCQSRIGSESNWDTNQSNNTTNNNIENECNDNQNNANSETMPNSSGVLITINHQETSSIGASSPTDAHNFVESTIQPKLETFNWFEAVQQEEINECNPLPNLNNLNSSGHSSSNKYDTSNPTSPQQERISPQSSHTNRSRRNSLNRFRSEFYRQSNEDLRQNEKRSTGRNDGKQQQLQNYQQQSWRNSGRQSPRNDARNGYNKRNDYDRENSNNNVGRHNDGGNFGNRRNLVRGGSVDSKVKDFNTRNRHDSFNRRNQENDNFEHFQSYNRKTYSRNKDNFMNNRSLPPRLQQKLQQQRSDYNNDCDNPKRFNNRNNTNSSVNANKGNKKNSNYIFFITLKLGCAKKKKS